MGIFTSLVTKGGNLVTSGLEKLTGKEFGRTTPQEFLATRTGRTLQTGATLTTLALGAATGLGIVKTTIGLIGGGILLESPKARRAVGSAITSFDPGTVGSTLGESIESGEVPSIGGALKGAGIVGGLAALGIGAAVGIPKVISKVKKPKFAEKPITPETQIIQTQPEVPIVASPTVSNGKAVNVNVHVTQRQTRKIKNIVVFQ